MGKYVGKFILIFLITIIIGGAVAGGAVLTADYAEKIGADYYCKDAMKSVEAAQEVFS